MNTGTMDIAFGDSTVANALIQMTRILILLLISTTHLIGQDLEKFVFSECLKECTNDSSKVEEITSKGNLTVIKLKTYGPCNGNFLGSVESTGNYLNLKFWTRPALLKDKKGKTVELVEVADCNCVFKFNYEIRGVENVAPTSIKVNGLTLKQIDAGNIWSNEALDIDSIR